MSPSPGFHRPPLRLYPRAPLGHKAAADGSAPVLRGLRPWSVPEPITVAKKSKSMVDWGLHLALTSPGFLSSCSSSCLLCLSHIGLRVAPQTHQTRSACPPPTPEHTLLSAQSPFPGSLRHLPPTSPPGLCPDATFPMRSTDFKIEWTLTASHAFTLPVLGSCLIFSTIK